MWLDFNKKINFNFFKNKYTIYKKTYYYYSWKIKILKFLYTWYNSESKIMINTSGTTNYKKKFYVKKVNMINSALMTINYFNLKKKQTTILCLSIDFIAAKMVLIRSILLQWKVLCIVPSSNPFKEIKNYNYSFDLVSMVPLQAYYSLSFYKQINKLLIGGGEISKKLEQKIIESKIKCYHSYGMTETLGHIAIRNINKKYKYFKCFSNIKITMNKKGCLNIYAPKLITKKIETNDLVKIFKKRYFIWIGRYDNIINTGGIKISSEIIERKLINFINKPFFIAGLPDNLLGQIIVLFIEGDKSNINISKNIFLKKEKFFFPKKIYFLKSFIRTSSQKIKKQDTINLFLKNKI